jgi:hypothetical protein
MFEGVIKDTFSPIAPRVLYHYTSWKGAEGILFSQRFWATDHACTNDKAELKAANSIIVEVAKELRATTNLAARHMLGLFIDEFQKFQVSKRMNVYLSCFSTARDDQLQFERYGDDGRGVCLGLRVLDEVAALQAGRGTRMLKVYYTEESWREHIAEGFGPICSAMSKAAFTRENFELGLLALFRSAAAISLGAKEASWQAEQEYRLVTLVPKNAKIKPAERWGGDGKKILYLPDLALRANGKLFALAEIVIGPNQVRNDGFERLNKVLAEAGYKSDDFEYPNIVASQLAPWEPRSTQEVNAVAK